MRSAQGPRRGEKVRQWSPAGRRFRGVWTWLSIHIAFLTGYRNRLGALLAIGWQAR
jgi:hypothetical protein